jgi:hypothetical protein
VRKHHVAELVANEGVELGHVAAEVHRPVLAQLLGAQHQHALAVAQLKVFDDRQRGIGLAQAHAVGQDAAVVGVDLLDGALDAVFLEIEQGFPDFGVGDGGVVEELGLFILPGKERLEDVEQGLEVDELGRMIHVELSQVFQHFGFDILHQCGV